MKYFIIFISTFFLLSCQRSSEDAFKVSDLDITWTVVENLGGTYVNGWKISNRGSSVLPPSGWTIYYNHVVGVPTPESTTGSLKVTQVCGTFYSITPTESFTGLGKGESASFELTCFGSGIKITDAPNGLYMVLEDEQPELVHNYKIGPFPPEELMRRAAEDKVPIPTTKLRYEENSYLSRIELSTHRIIPTPTKVSMENGFFEVGKPISISHTPGLENEAQYLIAKLELLNQSGSISSDAAEADVHLAIKSGVQAKQENYDLVIGADGIQIIGTDPAGVFYGVQSLIALWPLETEPQEIQYQVIDDGPRFPYRGMHLDVARNFHQPESIKKVLDLMSFYKLNKLHFHLTDDEGWRLEIPGIPELTDIGAVRGHTTNELDHLQPAYGSGPFPEASENHGTGHYTREQFIDILQYAAARHIEVIPEINFPGHARAAVKSMEARAHRIETEGSDETSYLLHDPEDQSQYTSVQGYHDNVICPCQESVYNFIEKVVAEVVKIYQDADVKLTTIHTGGDEVPTGIWEASPLCQQFLAENPQIDGISGLSKYFLQRYQEILDQQDLVTAGWEEIAMHRVSSGDGDPHGNLVPNPDFVDKNLLPYVWNSNWGTSDDLAYKLANTGYQVILCNATNLYFDFAYNKDPMEPGFYWSGLVDTRKPFELVPLDVVKTATVDIMGNDIDLEAYQDHVKLSEQGKQNVVGIQGELWSETVKGPEMLEYYLFPKIMGLSERAWAADPEWANHPRRSQRLNGLNESWNHFANIIGQRELNRLDILWDGVNYRVPLPGAVIEDGLLKANVAFPGLEIRYTLDGTEPNAKSPLYQSPVEAKKPVKLKAFTGSGKSSRVSILSY